jgi:hypothetical protein
MKLLRLMETVVDAQNLGGKLRRKTGQQQWSCTNFRCSDRTLRSRDRIFEFSQEIVKICSAAKNLDTHVNFGLSGRYNQPVHYRRDVPIKAEWPELGSHLGSTWLRGSTSTRIWTRALQPDQEEVSSWRFRRAQIVSRRQTFPPTFWLGAEIFARRWDFNAHQGSIVRLYFYIFTRRLYFVCPPRFSWDDNIWAYANVFIWRQDFRHTPIFSWDAKISGIRQ